MKAELAGAGPLWAITSYFNPLHYRHRRSNYRVFRQRLKVPLLAVELSFNGRFELEATDAEIIVRCHSRDVMWQKERLLNLALAALPAACEQVVSVDCDVVFARHDWMSELQRRLKEVPLAQVFSRVRHLPMDLLPEDSTNDTAIFEQQSTTAVIAEGTEPDMCIGRVKHRGPGSRASGFAWAARRELLEQHGFYDACIIGGGDTALLSAAYGVFDRVIDAHQMNPRQRAYYLRWAEPFYCSVRGQVACIEGDLLHLWHGDLENRRAFSRHGEFAQFHFDPFVDIAMDSGNCWRWNSDKPLMHAHVAEHFARRKEDGDQSPACMARLSCPAA